VRQQLARYGGVAAFLLGIGLSLTGWTNAVVGVMLVVLGVLWVVAVLAGPPLARRARDYVVAEVARELGVAQEASTGKGPSDEEQHEARIRWLKGVAWRMAGELTVARERIEEAQRRGVYWDSDHYRLVADEWSENQQSLSDEPELQGHYMPVRLAYEELNRVNTIVIGRQNHSLVPSNHVDPSDRLDDAVKRVREGERRLRGAADAM